MILGLGEILGKAATLKTKQEKIDYLQKNDSQELRDIIQYALHPEIKWDLPEGKPPYSPTPALDQENMLRAKLRQGKLALFVNDNGKNLTRTNLENLFIQILESTAPKDAELLCMVKDRKLPKGLTHNFVNEVWPGLLPNEVDQKVSQE